MNNKLKQNIDKWFERNWIYYTREVSNNIAKDQMSQYSHDLCVHCFESFMAKTEEQIQQMYDDNKIINYLLYCCSFQLRSSTSPFYQQYRKHRNKSIPEYFGEQVWDQNELTSVDDYYECMMEALSGDLLDFYEKRLIQMKYIEGKTFKEIFKEYNFSHLATRKHLYKALDKVEQYCNKKLEE